MKKPLKSVTVKFKVDWDTDGRTLKACGLKKSFTVTIPCEKLDWDSTSRNETELGHALSEWLSGEYGFCHKGFTFTWTGKEA